MNGENLYTKVLLINGPTRLELDKSVAQMTSVYQSTYLKTAIIKKESLILLVQLSPCDLDVLSSIYQRDFSYPFILSSLYSF